MAAPHRGSRSPLALLILAAVWTSGCGGGGGLQTSLGSDDGASAGVSRAVVIADVDGDGRGDVLDIPLAADVNTPDGNAPRCWRTRLDGSLEAVADAHALPAVAAIRGDLLGRPDDEILLDEGAHRTAPDRGAVPYAVLHLDRPTDLPEIQVGAPLIEALHPDAGQPGSLVGIEGSDLAMREETPVVTIGGVEARVVIALPRFVLAVVPGGAPLGDVDVVVTRGAASSLPATFEVRAVASPQLDSVQPDPLVPGVLAILRGRDLGMPSDEVRVTFGGAEAPRVLALGRIVFAEVPATAVSGPVTVTVGGSTSNAVEAEIAAQLDAPTLTGLTPARASPGSLVRIAGDDLLVIGQATRVHFGTADARIFGRERGALLAVVPDGADGDVTVAVGDRTSGGLAFERVDRGAPVISALVPTSGRPGQVVRLEGVDLYDLSAFSAGGGGGCLELGLPRVTFGEHKVWFAFPAVGGVDVVVPFRAEVGVHEVVVTLDGRTSDPVAFTVE